MNKKLHILTAWLFLMGMASMSYAQTEPKPKVIILGNVYGGGELAQVVETNADSVKSHIIQDADLATLFTTHADHVYTTYVHLGENSEVYGRVFGGGKGQEDSQGESAGRVTGQTDVALDGATVWSEIYGGGEMADVRGNTLVHFKKGKAGHNAYGGGLGKLTETEENGIILPDNRQTVLASADIKLIPKDYNLITNDNAANLATLKALDLNTSGNWMADKKTGESFVVFDGKENADGTATYTHYEFMTARTVNRDAEGKPIKVDGLYYTETQQYDAENLERLFSIDHNIYGGGMTASKVEGKTFVHINYGMVNDEMMSWTGYARDVKPVWSNVYNSIANAQFCVFGGGYGYHTDILGDANVTMDVQGDGKYKYIEEFTEWFAGEGKTKYGWDTNTGEPEKIYAAADEAKWSHGAPGRSCMDIVGGGYNGKVHGTTNITVGGDVVLRKVYGGGYYSSVGNTNVTIKSGIFNRIYGGGLIGNVYGKANLTLGQQGGDEVHNANLHLLIKDAVYGGNDVSGTVGTTDPGSKTNTQNGVTYNVFDPVDDNNHGVRLNIYGGLVLGDVYGAGNGNHPGYGNPDYMEFIHSQHPSENYRTLPHAGEKGTQQVYKYRPRTARVEMTLQGNAGENFNDDPQVDKVRIWGRTFGGGNSCNVGVWDGTQDDNPEVYADDASSWHPGDNFTGNGTIQINIGSHVQLGNRNDSHTTPNGLFMGSNGEHMITQHTDKDLARYYHQYYDSKTGKYYPGFVVYEDDAETPIKRTVGLKAFKAFINNILTKSDNVHLNVKNMDDTDAEDVWMSNFVGGGYRGSMQAATATGKFDYTLPEGVTVGHSVVGGAFNAHVIYRVYATEYGTGLYTTDANGNYQYETVEPSQGVISKAEAEALGQSDYDYIRKLYAEGHEGDEDYKTGYLRYNFDGGMLAHDSEMNAETTGSRIHQVHADPRTNASEYTTAYFEPLTVGDNQESDAVKAKLFRANKDKALVQLHLNCALHPTAHDEVDPETKEDLHDTHGGLVYGGCFSSGYIDGDTWVDYGCWLSPLCVEPDENGKVSHFFDKSDNISIYGDVADLEHIRALSVYGAGYGEDTHSMGDVYVYIKSTATEGSGDEDKTGKFPYIFNVFGGGNLGTVAGNTNVYYAVGKQGTLLGSLYGGGYKGDIGGNTFVELAEGFVTNVYGGSRQANIGGASHVWAYDGKFRGLPESNHLIICNLYGGNDIAGTIRGTMPAAFTASKWGDVAGGIEGKQFNTYVEISADDNSADRGFPLIGSVFAGGNGEKWTEESGVKPEIAKTLLEIDGGSTLRAFGGGNMATVTDSTHIFTNATSTHFANVTFAEYQTNIMKKVFFHGQYSGYQWDNTTLNMHDTHVFRLFGGNNLATMDIQPTWNLKKGFLENVYSGGNMGDMTYYNPDGVMARTAIDPATHDGVSSILGVENPDGTNVNLNPKGLSITINSPDIRIGSLFGGCRMSDVNPTPKAEQAAWPIGDDGVDCYGATVNILDGNIGYIFGGNDVSGKVEHGTNINISGGVIGQVYGSGNGDYLYKFIPAKPGDDKFYTAEEKSDTANITEHIHEEYGIYYTVPEKDKNGNAWDDASEGDTHKIMTINKIRPSVDNAFINIAGLAPDNEGNKRITLIKGNVYMGGNATTITRGHEEAFTKFKYGSYAVAGGLYMGSDGQDYTQDETITKFAELNGISDMGASTQFNDEDDARHNPILLNAYLTAVDMNALPKEFATIEGLRETYVGTLCGGGNRGSMLVNKTIDLVIPAQITIFDKVVAGCNDATVNYNHNGRIIKSIGGYTRPVDIANNDGKGNVKINYNIAAQFVPLKLDVPMGADLRVPVNRTDLNDKGETWAQAIEHAFLSPRLNAAGDAYTTGCNIYGGCYSSGEIEGDVVLNVHSNMLRYANEAKLKKAIANDEACFNVFGAGFGQESHVWGNVHIKLDKSNIDRLAQPEDTPIGSELLASKYLNGQNHMTTFNTPSVNNIFGGGRNGKLIGNTTIEIRNGRVYNDVAGGCFASDMYGSSHIIVGYPTYYQCNTSGEYTLKRGDQWNIDKGALKTSVKYLKGDLVPQNVYEQIVAHTAENASKFTNATVAAPDDWSTVDIKIGKGIYGGGYSLANSTSASAGSITSHKLQATPDNLAELETLHPLNFDSRNGLEDKFITEGYGGNSAIMVGDQAGNGTADHIHISTLITKPVTFTQDQISAGATKIGLFSLEGGKYTHLSDGAPTAGTTYYDLSGDGGIYGDGHLTFCEGFRAADIYGYGYNTGTVKYPLLMNTFQRLDLLDVNDCCLMLQGAQDFTINEKIDATIYSMTRIGELRMKSSLDDYSALGQISAPTGNEDGTGQDRTHQRNYLGFFNNVHYLGSIVTNDIFDDSKRTFHGSDGVLGSNSYKAEKTNYITAYTNADDKNNAAIEFKKRNVGTARNVIGINNGFCLRIQNQYKKNDNTYGLYYGPIVGVCEVKLLTLTQGEGGGYVYADNIHANEDNFLNTSGNFVFPGVVSQGNDGEGNPIADQYIVDDCFMDHYGTPGNITKKSGDLDEAHYWYVEGNKYFYQTTLTGYTFQDAIDFNLIDTDPNIILSGMQNGSTLNIKKIEWLSQHRDGYGCVLETTATEDDGHGNTIDKISDYQFDIEVAGTDHTNPDWTNHMPRHTTDSSPYTSDKSIQNDNLPQFNVKLQDKHDNSGDANYINHLDEPELVKIYLVGKTDEQTYEYTITMNIVYLQGPTYEGGVTIENCALPGERIGFSSEGIAIKTPNLMPVTAASWQILPFKEIDSEGKWRWDEINGIGIPKTQYEDLNGHLAGWVPALYNHNEYNIAYIFTAGGHNFPVMPKQDAPLKQNRMIVVHNYHRMKDIVAQSIEESVIAGARVYIKDEEDLAKFVAWMNAGKRTEEVHFILQDSIMLTSALPTITQPFAGTFHGDGYHINLNGKQTSLFGNKLTGKVYNLGMVGGTIADNMTNVVNSYVYNGEDAFTYGAKAYELSHHFTPGDSYNADGYVESRYANGDYQYATSNHVWSLRTADPYYGHTDTHHDMAHTHDVDRWQDTDPDDSENADILTHTGYNQPLYDGTMVIADVNIIDNLGNISGTKLGLPEGYANDYLFFGQHLDTLQGDSYPTHITSVAPGDKSYDKGGNRIYKTGGYYRSKVDQKFYYNKDAWALQPTLTAIDYTDMTAEGDHAATMPTRFNVDSNADHDDNDSDSKVNYDNATTGHVSQNLLVYNQGEDVFDYNDVDKSTEASVRYHNIVKDGEGNFATNYLHLVDKQDFNAPKAFSVPERIWYERMPGQYRNLSETKGAWEGICLPFTAKCVVADENGEISHFYNDSDLNHEYWLRGLTAVTDNKATFCRVGKEGTEGTFVDSRQHGIEYNYYNTYFFSLEKYNGETNFGRHYADAAEPEGVTFTDYIPLTASVPYIIALPGNDYYEFSMEGSDYSLATHSKTGNPQAATFENRNVNIVVSDNVACSSSTNGYSHIGSYTHTTGAYTLDADGNAFDQNNEEVIPFRTYIMKTAGSMAAPHRLLIEDWNKKTIEEEEPEEAIENLKISVRGRTIVVESPFDLPVDIQTHTLSGHMVYRHTATKGITSFTLPQAGIYLIGRKKISVY